MTHLQKFWFPLLIAVALLIVSAHAAQVQADLIRLKHGGEVRGTLQPSEQEEESLTVRTLSGTTIVVSQDDAEFVQTRPLIIEEYFTKSRQSPHTVDARWELAEWSRIRGLDDQRIEQLEQILEIDPDHADARRILGYERHLDSWIKTEDLMKQQGYVRHRGRWITTQEWDLIQQTTDLREQEQEWQTRIRRWLAWLRDPVSQRKGKAIEELNAIRDPAAIPALTKFMANDADPEVRSRYVAILNQIEGGAPTKALVERWLLDDNENIRHQAMSAIVPERQELALPLLFEALRNPVNLIVHRAAEGLGRINDPRAIEPLIGALVTSHLEKIEVPTGTGVTFARMPPGTVPVDMGNGIWPVPFEIELMARTGQLPYGYRYHAPQLPQPTKTVTIRVEVVNVPVLNALRTLTGQDFGFNQVEWYRRWGGSWE